MQNVTIIYLDKDTSKCLDLTEKTYTCIKLCKLLLSLSQRVLPLNINIKIFPVVDLEDLLLLLLLLLIISLVLCVLLETE